MHWQLYLCLLRVFFCRCCCFFFSSRRRHTRCALVTGVQTCALPIWPRYRAAHRRQISRGDGLWLVGAKAAAESAGGIILFVPPRLDPGSMTSARRWIPGRARHDEIRGEGRLTFWPYPHSCAASRDNASDLRTRAMKIRKKIGRAHV